MKKSKQCTDRYGGSIRNWWLWLLLGIAMVAIGILVLIYPGESYLALSLTFGILMLASGIVQVIMATSMAKTPGWGWLLASGIIEIILGLMLAFNLILSALVLPYVLAFWLLFRCMFLIGMVSDMRFSGIKGSGWTIALVLLLLLLAFMVLLWPAIGIGAIILWLALAFMVAGVSTILFSFQLRSLRKYLRN